MVFKRGARCGQRVCCGVARLLGPGECLERITFAGQAVGQFGLAASFGIEPRQALLGLRKFGIGDAPFGFNPGLRGSSIGEGDFGCAQITIGIVERGSDDRAALFIGGKRFLAVGQFALQPRQRCGGIVGQPVGIAAVFLQPLVLAVEILELFLGRFELAGQLGHAVAMGRGIVAAVGEFVARFGQGIGRGVLGVLG